MSATAAGDLNRIIQLVAEDSREALTAVDGGPLADLAARLGTTAEQVQRDLRTLTAISDDASAEWLQSLSVWQEGDRISAASLGPYRRPVRFTPEELLAIRVGLALEGDEGEAVWRTLAAVPAPADGEAPASVDLAGPAGDSEAHVVELARRAVQERRALTILYTGERDFPGSPRTVEPHQVAGAHGRFYVVAWCRRAAGWRHFRADRVVDAMLEAESFTPRADFTPLDAPGDVFRAGEEDVDEVVVRFGPAVARWLAERFPEARRRPDGGLEVTYRVVEPAWLVRTVLQYGEDAEVVAPAAYRAAVRRALNS